MQNAQILFLLAASNGYPGDIPQQVQAGAVGSIVAGIPVGKALGQNYVLPLATGTPVVGTDFMAGISATLSTDTVANDGTVSVSRIVPGVIYLIKPLNPATYFGASYATAPSQSTYNALVGSRVLFDLTSNVYTIANTDNASNGLVVENIDVTRYPGLVAFSIRQAIAYTN
jgi:hypothetical protein